MKILLFIGLKIAEILVVVFVPYLLGRLVCLIPLLREEKEEMEIPYWVVGLMILTVLAFLFIIGLVNWRLVNSIMH